jgi:deazaflavin-dependent oxidoreductase (nitroreductase family)
MKLDGKVPEKMMDWAKNHVRLYQESGGREGHHYKIPGQDRVVPCLLLATTGRRTPGRLIFPLIYGQDGANCVIIASKGGAPDHPQWYGNLVADPKVQIQVGETVMNATASRATGAERQRLWDLMATIWPPYNEYQQKAGTREIPVVVLKPS